AVSSVIQFGNELQSALLQRDNEYMTLLVQTQQATNTVTIAYCMVTAKHQAMSPPGALNRLWTLELATRGL
ncbi:hypothetical protein ACIOZM_20480, partial [Pseudomonas sp. NPDC087346]|uniref:hypothetical protein n=1 Tax=Pseudomonas sp. NPDC087346 TaxID=3364438 RepID=UPI0038140538